MNNKFHRLHLDLQPKKLRISNEKDPSLSFYVSIVAGQKGGQSKKHLLFEAPANIKINREAVSPTHKNR
tara:strand:- start:4616 stop:4822 length:207 start_codon:yes stop_codon:yes gene_type:complete